MSSISALGYMVLTVSDLTVWAHFARDILGLSVVGREDGALDLRCDTYAWRIRLEQGPLDDIACAGWEVSGPQALADLKATLQDAGVFVEDGTPAQKEDRCVEDLICFSDPEGLPCEAYYGPLQRTNVPCVGPFGTVFKTGSQGLGHIVLTAKDLARVQAFYTDVLGFRISDYIKTEVVQGAPLTISFMRCNARHHSLALAPVPIKKRLVHFMLEAGSIDDVGRALYRTTDAGHHLSFTLGRHSNDEMLSFYVLTPSGFDVEYGWGGLAVEDASWQVRTHDVNSAWGHHFQRPPRKAS